MKSLSFITLLLISINLLTAQPITWIEQQNSSLPEGVKLYKGTRTSPRLQAFYLDVDLNNDDLIVRPYIFSQSGRLPDLAESAGAFAAVNGGFFGGSTSYSSVIYPGEIKARNVSALTRNSSSYPVIRSLFSMDTLKQLSVDWIYHFDNSLDGLYAFDAPLLYAFNDPTPQAGPITGDGQKYAHCLTGIGGGPTLVKGDSVHITYNEEIFWGSGVGLDNRDPRTAAGYTADNHVILFTADGRQGAVSEGVGLTELAEILISLGCVEAMNLDGGGSTGMAAGGSYVNSPSEQRSIPTILAVTHIDSLGLPEQPVIEKIIDTGDTANCKLEGNGWFQTANAGYWGDTPSMLNQKGPGDAYAVFKPGLTSAGTYDVYGWWVAASNRCTDTPFVIHHKNGIDTVRVNQVDNGSSWFLVGRYEFTGDPAESVIISEAASGGTYIVADAVRFVSYDSTAVNIENKKNTNSISSFKLNQNYPNPFNSATVISYHLSAGAKVELNIYNNLGQRIKTLVSEEQQPGYYSFKWDGKNQQGTAVGSGIYFYKMISDNYSETKKMLLLE